jgi:hypothetical protein
MKTLFGLFLIAHAWIHTGFISKRPPQKPGAPVWPFELTRSWLLTPLGLPMGTIKAIGLALTLAVLVGFTVSGLGWLGIPGLKAIWVPVTVFSSIASLLLLFFFWHPWLVLGIAIDIAILYFIYARSLKLV